ncbi:hypothetical protein LMG29542_08621 [Paraburkholderia humisilvae]|uniref:Uncharacterized protein n=1 Tax=Paraburkholderia humisilvae TaxID=627669 RepID=A0A6J5F8V8_9BURK|nr:hypothetical protein LMG29542_08621 [Paraburkholderia humisilvae]
MRSNSASVTKPSSSAACLSVWSWSIAWWAIFEALSYPITGASAVTSISDRSTYSSIFFRFGRVPSTRKRRKFVHPSVSSVIDCARLWIINGL